MMLMVMSEKIVVQPLMMAKASCSLLGSLPLPLWLVV
jgi:hypothetical protein